MIEDVVETRSAKLQTQPLIDIQNRILERYAHTKPHILDTELASMQGASRPIADELLKRNRGNLDGIWIDHDSPTSRVLAVSHSPNPLGGKDTSAHKVFLVEAHLQVGSSHGIFAVSKPFSSAEGAIKEFINISLIRKRGFATLVPLCTLADVVQTDRAGFLITTFEENLTELEKQTWVNPARETPQQTDIQSQRLEQIARLMAEWHQKGIYHGDAQVKNFAVLDLYPNQSETQIIAELVSDFDESLRTHGEHTDWVPTNREAPETVIGIDWESSEIYQIASVTPELLERIMYNDLVKLFLSLNNRRSGKESEKGVEFISDSNALVSWNVFDKRVVSPYIEGWLAVIDNYDSPYPNVSANEVLDALAFVQERLRSFVFHTKNPSHPL